MIRAKEQSMELYVLIARIHQQRAQILVTNIANTKKILLQRLKTKMLQKKIKLKKM